MVLTIAKKSYPICIFLTVLIIFGLAVRPELAAAEQVIVDFSTDELDFALVERSKGYVLSIKPKGGLAKLKKDLTANIFSIENPTRLVIDIPNFASRQSKAMELVRGQLSALRIGIHPDKTRIVLDITGENQPNYEISSSAELGALLVDIGFENNSAANKVGLEDSANFGAESSNRNIALPAQLLEPVEQAVIDDPKSEESDSLGTAVESNDSFAAEIEADDLPIREDPPTPQQAAELLNIDEDEDTELDSPAESPSNTLAGLEPLDELDKTSANTFVVRQNRVVGAPGDSIDDLQNKLSTKTNALDKTAEGSAAKNTALNAINFDSSENTANSGNPLNQPGDHSGPIVLQSIQYLNRPQADGDGEDGVVMISLNRLSTYSLSKRGDNLYELSLDNASLKGEYLTLPQFPPDSFVAFEVLMAEQQSDNVVIKIFVEEGIRLSPFIANGQLFVKTAGS